MPRLADVRRFLDRLQRRSNELQQQMRRLSRELADIDEAVAWIDQDIAALRQGLAEGRGAGAFSRSELFRARGREAAVLFKIACRQREREEQLQLRQQLESGLELCRKEALRLQRKQDKHREWWRKQKTAHASMRERQIAADILEGGHGHRHRSNNPFAGAAD